MTMQDMSSGGLEGRSGGVSCARWAVGIVGAGALICVVLNCGQQETWAQLFGRVGDDAGEGGDLPPESLSTRLDGLLKSTIRAESKARGAQPEFLARDGGIVGKGGWSYGNLTGFLRWKTAREVRGREPLSAALASSVAREVRNTLERDGFTVDRNMGRIYPGMAASVRFEYELEEPARRGFFGISIVAVQRYRDEVAGKGVRFFFYEMWASASRKQDHL